MVEKIAFEAAIFDFSMWILGINDQFASIGIWSDYFYATASNGYGIWSDYLVSTHFK